MHTTQSYFIHTCNKCLLSTYLCRSLHKHLGTQMRARSFCPHWALREQKAKCNDKRWVQRLGTFQASEMAAVHTSRPFSKHRALHSSLALAWGGDTSTHEVFLFKECLNVSHLWFNVVGKKNNCRRGYNRPHLLFGSID